MTSPAEKEGLTMLRKYRNEKIQNRNTPIKNNNDTSNSGDSNTFEAIAEGSRLGFLYSTSKRKDIGHRSTLLDITNELPDNDKEALEMLRIALSQLSDDEKGITDDDKNLRIISMLRGVEERLENSAKNNPISSYSPTLNRKDLSAIMNLDNESSIRTPVLDRSGLSGRSQRSVVKIYMDNQLELNEKEGQEYENKFNELYEMLTEVENERDELKVICDELTEKSLKEKETYENEMNEVTNNWNSEKEILTSTIENLNTDISNWKRLILVEEEKNSVMLSQLERLQQVKIIDDEKINSLMYDLDEKQLNIENLQKSIEEFKLDSNSLKNILHEALAQSEDLRMQNATLTLRANEVSILEKKLEFSESTIAELNNEIEKAKETSYNSEKLEITINNLKQELQLLDERAKYAIALEDKVSSMNNTVDELRQELIRSQARANEADQLQNMIVNLNVELNSSKDEVNQLNSKIKLLKGEVEEKIYLNKSIEITLESEREIAKKLQIRTQSLGEELDKARNDLINMTNERDLSISRMSVNSLNDDDESMYTALGGSDRKSLQPQNDRSILNVYMDNTLDLNMKEMEYYETALDDLQQQLASMTQERDELRGFYDQWEREKEDLDATIEELRSDIDDKNKVIEDLIDEKNRLQKGGDEYDNDLQSELLETKNELSKYKDLLEAKDLEVELASNAMLEMQKQFDEIKLQILDREKDRSKHGKSYSRNQGLPSVSATPMSLLQGVMTPGNMSIASQMTFFTNDEYNELQKQVKQKEDLTKFQISQLHLLQDSLSEQKKANAILKDHKKGLKEMVEKLRHQLDESTKQISTLNQSCQSYQAKSNEIEKMLEDAVRVKDVTNNQLLSIQQDLLQYQEKENVLIRQNSELLIQIEVLNNKIKTSTNELSGNKAVQSAKKRVEELTSQMSEYVRQNDDFKVLNGKLQGELRSKEQLISDLTNDLNKSRDQLQVCLSDLADMKSDDDHHHNESNYIIEEKEKSIIKLNELIETYELENAELNASIREKDAELLERSISFYDDDDDQVQQLSEQLNSKNEAIAFFEREVTVLQRKLSEKEINTTTNSSPTNIRLLEKNREIDILKEIVDELEKDLSKTKKQLFKIQNENKFIKDLIESQNTYSKKCEDELLKKVSFHFNHHDVRLQNVKQMITHLHNDKAKGGTKNDIQMALEDTQYALKQAMEKAEADYADRQYLLNQLEISQQEQEFLDRTLDEVRLENENRTKLTEAYMTEEYSKLQERLEAAEKRAIEMSTNGTKAFAKSARTIGYLEGETLRLKNLVDHFRIITVKLGSDLKAANEEGMKAKSLEHRLQTMFVTEEQLLLKTKQLEALLQTKEAELIAMQRMVQELEEKRLEVYETEITQLQDKIRTIDDAYATMARDHKQLQQSASEMEQVTRLEIQKLNDTLTLLKEELSKKVAVINMNEQNIKTLQKTVRDKENSLAETEGKLLSLHNEDVFNQNEWSVRKSEYEKDLQEKINVNDQLEEKVQAMITQIKELEDSIVLKDEMITSTLLRQATAAEELRQKRLILEVTQTEVASLNGTIEDLRAALNTSNDDLNSLKEQYLLLKNTTHHEALLKLADSEMMTKSMSYELDNLKSDLHKAHEQLGVVKSRLESSEKQLEDIRAKNITLSADEQVLHANIESLSSDNKQLKAYLDESNNKLSLAQEMILKYEDDNQHLTDVQSQMKARITTLEETNESMKEAEMTLANEMRSFTTFMTSGLNLSENEEDCNVTAEISLMIQGGDGMNPSIQAFNELRSKSEALLVHDTKLSESLKKVTEETAKSNSACKRLDEELASLSSHYSTLENKYNSSEEMIKKLKEEVFTISREKAEIFTSIEEASVTMEYQLKRLENIRRDFISKSNDGSNASTSMVWLMDKDSVTEKFTKLLSYYTNENETVMQGLCQQVESVMNDMSNQINKESTLSTDLHESNRRISSLEEEVNVMTNDLHVKLNDISKLKIENEKLSGAFNDISRKTNELEAELQDTANTNYDLRDALNEAEKAVLDFKSKIRQLQSDNERRTEDIQSITAQSEQLRKKLSDNELMVEKNQTLFSRVVAEKESLENIKRSLEGELERSRIEINGLRAQSKGSGDESRISFEIEKLLAAFGTTLEHLSVIGSHKKGKVDESVSDSFDASIGSPSKDSNNSESANITNRVEYIVKRLGELRLWSRDEMRVKRSMEDKIESLEKEVNRNHSVVEEIQAQLKKALLVVNERDENIKNKSKEIQDLTFELNNSRDHVMKLRLQDESRCEALEEEKKNRNKYINDLHTKESELNHLKVDLENNKKMYSKSQEHITQLKEKISSLEKEVGSKAELLKLAKANNSKLTTTIEQLESGLEKDKKDREALEKKLTDAESGLGSASRWKLQISELEASLKTARDIAKQAVEDKSSLEDNLGLSTREIEVLKKKLSAGETRVTSLQSEKADIEIEIVELKSSLQTLKENYDEEVSKRQLFEATLAAFKKNSDINIDAHLSKDSSERASLLADEEEKRTLKSSITNMKLQLDEKESQRQEEASSKIKAKNEIEKLKVMLEKASRELTVSNERASMLRGEGRKARKRIQESVGQIRDIVNIVRVEASSIGKDLATPAPKGIGKVTFGDDNVPDVGFAEALGVAELTTALSALRESIVWLREDSHDKVEMQATIDNLKTDKSRLENELQRVDKLHNEKTHKLREEITILQAKVNANPNNSIVNPYASSNDGINTKKIAVLEARIQKEVQAKEHAVSETSSLRDKIDKLSKALKEKNDESLTMGRVDNDNVHALKKEVKALKEELHSANYHRNVLKETTESLERQLMKKIDNSDDNNDNNNDNDGRESLRRQLARFKARVQALEELVNIYRSSVLVLQSVGGGNIISTSNNTNTNSNSNSNSNSGGVLELEIVSIKKNYEEEIKVLEGEVIDLQSKLRESNLYVSELRKRFEETMKVMYRPGNSTNTDILLSQLDSMSKALEQSENNCQMLTQSLSSERGLSRKRVSSLVDSLLSSQRSRDATLVALRQLEAHCVSSGIEHFAVYEALRSELTSVTETSGRIKEENIEQQKAISKLLKGLIESDHELLEAERREKKRFKEKVKYNTNNNTDTNTNTNTSHSNSNSISMHHINPPHPPFVVKHNNNDTTTTTTTTIKSALKSTNNNYNSNSNSNSNISSYSFRESPQKTPSSSLLLSAMKDKNKSNNNYNSNSNTPSVIRFDDNNDRRK